jgi:hypothetical protein
VFLIVLLCLLFIFHSTAYLDLSVNSLTGTIPSQILLMSKLCECSVVWLLVLMDCCHVFFIVLSCLLVIFHSTDNLQLYNNNFMGEFTCPGFIDDCWISCDFLTDTYTQTCRSL